MSTTRERPGKEQESPPKLDLTATQVVASSLAAVSAAVASSKLGVGGTIMGAAAASAVATIGSAVYSHSIDTTRARLRAAVKLAPPAHAPSAAPASDATREHGPGSNAARDDEATVMLPAAELREPTRSDPGPADDLAGEGGGLFSGLRWGRLVLAMLMVFGLAFGYLTIAELGLGRSVAAVVNGEKGSGGTTLSRVVDPSPPDTTDSEEEDNSKDSDSQESADPDPSPESDPTDESTSDSEESDEPTESSSPTSDSSPDPDTRDAPAPTSGGDGASAQPGAE